MPPINIAVIATITIPVILAVFIQALLFLTLKTTGHLLNTLKGDEKLRKFLVGLGIGFLITGNLLQFIASF